MDTKDYVILKISRRELLNSIEKAAEKTAELKAAVLEMTDIYEQDVSKTKEKLTRIEFSREAVGALKDMLNLNLDFEDLVRYDIRR